MNIKANCIVRLRVLTCTGSGRVRMPSIPSLFPMPQTFSQVIVPKNRIVPDWPKDKALRIRSLLCRVKCKGYCSMWKKPAKTTWENRGDALSPGNRREVGHLRAPSPSSAPLTPLGWSYSLWRWFRVRHILPGKRALALRNLPEFFLSFWLPHVLPALL